MNTRISDRIHKAAHRHEGPLWLVGGPVRDAFLGQPCQDWDFVCRRARALARGVAQSLHAKFIVLDAQNRIYRVIVPSPGLRHPLPKGRGPGPVRQTPAKTSGGRSSEVWRPSGGWRMPDEGRITLDFAELQGKTIRQDLARRDFTINAMARSFPNGALIDPFHGRRDLKNRIVRVLSRRALVDDPLRALRAFRFAAQFQCQIERRTLAWIRQHRQGLAEVSSERIREELLRLWKQPHALPALQLMDRAGLLSQIFPEMEACRRTAIRYYGRGGVLKHSFETVRNLEWIFDRLDNGNKGTREPGKGRSLAPLLAGSLAPSVKQYLTVSIGGYPRTAWLKWAAWLHDIGKPATAKVIKGRLRFFEHEHVGATLAVQLGQRLRLSRKETQLLGLWVRNHMRIGNLAAAPRITEKAFSRFFRDLGEEGVGMILVSLADHYTYLRRSLWGKGADPVEKISRRLFTSYYEDRSRILPERLIDGHVLMKKLRLKPGPLIGELLEAVEDAQAEGKVTTREDALVHAKGFLRRHPGRL